MIDVASLERATLAAVPPQAQEELHGWLLGLDRGTVGRAHSAAPLQHEAGREEALPAIEARYRAHGIGPVFRVPRLDCFAALHHALSARGYAAARPTLVLTGTTAGMTLPAGGPEVNISRTPGEGWAQVFLGEGFDPVDGASRLAILRRGGDSVFASVTVDGRVAAVGSACFSQGWCGIHGMRTAPAFRGHGMATSILAALANEAKARGMVRTFLQVEEGNAKAQALYRHAGFAGAWAYEYWQA